MGKIRIKNFGPIKDGYLLEGGWMDIDKVTVFIGNQGSGKSSVAKLFSTLSWLEKAMYRGDISKISGNAFVTEFCAYQGIKNYFRPDTQIEYIGDAYSFSYTDLNLITTQVKINTRNLVPKIMYVPAERNFLSAVDEADKVNGLPRPLYTFLDEFRRAQKDLSGEINLPVGDMRFEYNQSYSTGYIVGSDYKINLLEASSGLQSLVPLYLVSRFLSSSINRESNPSINRLNLLQSIRLQEEIEKIMLDDNLSEELKQAALKLASSKYVNGCFINIVEEPEQNLFPSSQRQLLNSLLEFNNVNIGNKLVMATHSPYMINYLTLAVKAQQVKEKITSSTLPESVHLLNELYEVVPEKSLVSDKDWSIYELKDGRIAKLEQYMGVPEDENYLNHLLSEVNSEYGKLRKIEKKCL